MKVGIIVHSYTGNTLSVAQKLQEALLQAGHLVNIERVEAVNEEPSAAAKAELKTIPDISGYDYLIFAAPVRAFGLSPVMKLYLSGLPSLEGRKVGLFVTEGFPKAWMGGNRAVKQMLKACEEKTGLIVKTGVINWTEKRKTEQIKNLVEDFSKLYRS